MEIAHYSHDCALTFCKNARETYKAIYRNERKGMMVEAPTCRGCHQVIDGPAYFCYYCAFWLHDKCASLTKELKHPLHPQHTLKFYCNPDDSIDIFVCYKCRDYSMELVFRCQDCDFNLDYKCAVTTDGHDFRSTGDTKTEIYHFSHRHMLILFNSTDRLNYKCNGCQQLVSGPAYACLDCKFYLHKSCAEMLREITHAYHPLHPLRAQLIKNNNTVCDACGFRIDAIAYQCSQCDFYLHSLCAHKSLGVKSPLNHKFHNHNLYYFVADHLTRSRRLVCKVCREFRHGYFYLCFECKCYFHVECIPIPSNIKTDCHMHPLTLRNPLLEDTESYCFACEEERNSRYHAYYCQQCSYTSHIECVASEYEDEDSDYGNTPDSLSVKMANNRDEAQSSNNEYPILAEAANPLCKKQIETGDSSNNHILTFHEAEIVGNCFGCKAKISAAGYSCKSCNISLHKVCAEFPSKIRHPFHSLHPLTVFPSNSYEYFICDGCKSVSHAEAGYQCDECKFILDIECASLPHRIEDRSQILNEKEIVISHFSHFCKLTLANCAEQLQERCRLCRLVISGPAYCCPDCGFLIHKLCVDVPEELQTQYHPQHHLKLNNIGGVIGRCRVCASTIWSGSAYSCIPCAFELHITCANYQTSALKADCHEHNLFYFVAHDLKNMICIQRDAAYSDGDFVCNKCGKECNESFYRCLDCYFTIHLECIPVPKEVESSCHIHRLTLVDSVTQDNYKEHYCHVCESLRNPDHPVYYCKRCSFTGHIGCVLNFNEDEENISLIGVQGDISSISLQEDTSSGVFKFSANSTGISSFSNPRSTIERKFDKRNRRDSQYRSKKKLPLFLIGRRT